ncbi:MULTISPECIES: DUF58 domain-containing protein [unclassified Thermosynechococcus]|uniref:DUF58 domain-containing protein n=1 Tax=unclassified Thermosynechococcus TaxID=2622553 RepID=UPI0028734B3F|nr:MULTISPECIES: DUF58 domain-containing protein [unclassified Thermosynechococcus]WNC21585.1 DUF58 domain-containing protein [Thermosynechococcus sp. PP22]WNC31824.1 DUF58 domain-containing protein [Thermosynechococcus sp. PKX95]WNC34351.1 DUF58 domain-containing protein [Thermosynechococcus sp. PKX91]WNC36871.1 DUF58 domain-containing protein [Thermosynechococcus sp. WL11]WNC39392.1 DUF58 domain-containing protein [Thermosynechococcus sp. WL17]
MKAPASYQFGRHRPRWVPTVGFYGLLLLGLLFPVLTSFLPAELWPIAEAVPQGKLREWLHHWPLGLGWLLMGLYDLVIFGLSLWDYIRIGRWQLTLDRACESRLSIGRQNPIRLRLHTRGEVSLNEQIWVELYDYVPAEFTGEIPYFAFAASAQSTLELLYHVFPPRRGAFQWSGCDVRLRSSWGLAWRRWFAPVVTEVEVYPDLMGLRSLSIRLSLDFSGSLRRRRYALGGTEFAELREYHLGDDLRLMDWKASARRGRPLVRAMEPERDQPLIILLDRGRLMTATVAGLKRFDWGLNAALALALTGLRRGDKVGLGIFDQQLHTWIAPQSGDSHLGQILSQVYRCEPVLEESDYVGTVSAILGHYTRRALVVVLTEVIDEVASQELLAAMARLTPRFLPFCVALRDRHIETLAHRPLMPQPLAAVDQVTSLYEQAVALDLLHQRQRAFAHLEQQGVLVLDAPADQMSEQLVDRYLLLKARGRL